MVPPTWVTGLARDVRSLGLMQVAVLAALAWEGLVPGSAVAQQGPSATTQLQILSEGTGYVLHQVRGGVLLENGGVAILNGGEARVLLFDSDGSFDSATGRRGEGPGELATPLFIDHWRSDSLLVGDARLRAFKVGVVGAEFSRTFRADAGPFPATPMAVAGELIAYAVPSESRHSPSPNRTEVREVRVVVVDAGGSQVTDSFVLGETEWVTYAGQNGSPQSLFPVKGHTTILGGVDGFFLVAESHGNVVRWLDPSGAVARESVVEYGGEPLPAAALRDAFESSVRSIEPRRLREELVDALEQPTNRQRIRCHRVRLDSDEAGDVWLAVECSDELVFLRHNPQNDSWEPRGTLAGTGRVLDIRFGSVLVLHTSELGVEYLTVAQLGG